MIQTYFHRASAQAGALLCLGLALITASCGEEGRTPGWSNSKVEVSEKATVEHQQAKPIPGEGLRFMFYNVENWLTMERGRGVKALSKPEKEKQAVVDLIVAHRPDVIGLAEVGSPEDVADLQQRLNDAGLKMRSACFVSGSDSVRSQALLSRFPAGDTAVPEVSEFRLQGRTYTINRGILDSAIECGKSRYRFIGVHLKSKREVPYVDQEQMRIHEARLLRRHVDAILKADRGARLVVYGDFNDTRKSVAFKTVTGDYGSPRYLTAIPFRDSRGHSWTHYWEYQDVYSRIDFVAVTKALRREVDFRASYIVDDPSWNEASDHRPVLAIFR